MATKPNNGKHGASSAPPPQRAVVSLTPGQLRVLEMEDGDSFVMHTIRIADDSSDMPRVASSTVSEAAAHLSSWARRRHIRLAYRVIEKDTARIWRLGVV